MSFFPPRLVLDTARMRLLFGKRLVRIVVAAAALFLVAFLLLAHRAGYGRRIGAGLSAYGGKTGADDIVIESPFSNFHPVSIDVSNKTTKELCATFPRDLLNLVQPVLKMGHSEDRAKVEAQLDSVSACFHPDEILIFSDLDEEVRGHQVIDVLSSLPPGYYDQSYNPTIKSYLLQRQMKEDGTLDKDIAATERINGWAIDKYKFLPAVERAWLLKPDRPFYFFYESDTYVFWDNVFRFLQTIDPDKPVYMGSPSPGRRDNVHFVKTWFANGGPGYILSRAAVKTLVHRRSTPHGQYTEPSLTAKWLSLLTHDCCGDSVLGWALWNVGVPLQGYWPMFNPHPLHGIPFSDRYWCQPVLTLHKTSPEDVVDLWKWEFGQRKHERPLLYSDLFNFHHPGKPAILANWDNGDWDSWRASPEAGVDSFESCEHECRKDDNCLQWSWRGKDKKECVLMRSIRYGVARKPEQIHNEGHDQEDKWADYQAGWVVDRIEKWRAKRQCHKVDWVGPSITRVF